MCSMWCHDLDGDGASDLVCGAEDGKTEHESLTPIDRKCHEG